MNTKLNKEQLKQFKEWCESMDAELTNKVFHSDLTHIDYFIKNVLGGQ
jgi:hypothetical protein